MLLGLAALLLAMFGMWWFSAPVATVPVSIPTDVPAEQGAYIYVDVVGAVKRPGVVRLPGGSRVFTAIEAAGGTRPGALPGVNLARVLVDGEQLVVGAPLPGRAITGAAAATTLDLNAATVAELEALDGIGPVLAQRIVEYREHNGRFTTVRDLLSVPGVGDAKFAALADDVRVG